MCERISAVTVKVCPGSTNWPYFTLAACFSVTMLWAKSSLRRTSQAAACVIASSINTPGMTGKLGKWSAKYSSLMVKRFHRRNPDARLKVNNPVDERKTHGICWKEARFGQFAACPKALNHASITVLRRLHNRGMDRRTHFLPFWQPPRPLPPDGNLL